MLDLLTQSSRKLLQLEKDEYKDESKTDDGQVEPEDPSPFIRN